MRVALVNPNWTFRGSIYFGCRAPHLPMELGIAAARLRDSGHAATVVDAHMFDLSLQDIVAEVRGHRADMVVVTTAPTYLFWRCAPPELRVPQEVVRALRGEARHIVAVGPHGSTTPRAALRKLGVDTVVMGECEDVLVQLAGGRSDIAGTCTQTSNGPRVIGTPQATARRP